MKKTLIIALLIISFLIIYILQANFFSWFTIANVSPNLFVIFIIFISLFAGMKVSIPFAILTGLFLDIVIGKNIGPSTVMLGIIAGIGGYFDKNFSKESKLTNILVITGATCVYEIGIYIFQMIQLSIDVELGKFFIILLIELLYNAILTIIFYPLIQKTGYKMEDTFKEQKILTRYF